MSKKGTLIFPFSLLSVFCIILALFFPVNAKASFADASALGILVPTQWRVPLVVTEFGDISAVKVTDGRKGSFHLQFITLEPNSLFLPVLLHADMVFYVHTGKGTLSWSDGDNEIRNMNIRKGDIYRLHPGSVFYLQSSLEPERERLRIYSIFSNTDDQDIYDPTIGAYSSINDLLFGFDPKVLQAAFNVHEDVIQEMVQATKPPAIVHAVSEKKKNLCQWQARLLKAFLGSNKDSFETINGKKKLKPYNILEAKPDFENCNGRSLTVDKHSSHLFKNSNIGVFMVNLTNGAMMGPHWNPRASEIAIVLHGEGMIRVICSSTAKESECKNLRFRVKEGDVFAVPRFHPMAQMSFNNDSFVFMGFSTSTARNHPQFLAGKNSVLQFLDKSILAVTFNVTNTTLDQLLTPQKEAVILECTSCAEQEESKMEEEIERERQEEEEQARKREEEEARKREEEEAKKKEEEEARKREEEEARKREEEEAREREEEEARKREEEEARKREEEEARKREEEEARAREEEEARRRKEEERQRRAEEEARREEEERQRRAEEEARREEEERQRRAEEEEARRPEERQRRAEEEEEEARRAEKERQREAEEEEEAARRQEEERQRRGEKEARRERERHEEEPEEGGYEGERRVRKKVWKI